MKQKQIKTKSRIDELVARKEELELMKERKLNAMHERNSKRGTKIKKIENKAYQDKVQTDVEVAEIDREIDKTNKFIKLEQEYVFSATMPKSTIKNTFNETKIVSNKKKGNK